MSPDSGAAPGAVTDLGSVSAAPDLASLPGVRRFVEKVAAQANLPEDQAFNLKVAVSEACANAIEHAVRRSAAIDVAARLEAGRLTVSISSQGAFHNAGRGADVSRHRGFGLPLMVALTDEVCISRERGGGLRVGLSVYLPQ
jgi:anti-sigma regulatory factor (Ser/Thr protein kinase)